MNVVKRANSRWRRGNTRYPKEVLKDLEKYKEAPGWRHGAKVRRR